jgi:hypothetical protein
MELTAPEGYEIKPFSGYGLPFETVTVRDPFGISFGTVTGPEGTGEHAGEYKAMRHYIGEGVTSLGTYGPTAQWVLDFMITRWEASPCACYDCHDTRVRYHDEMFNGPELRAAAQWEIDNPVEY